MPKPPFKFERTVPEDKPFPTEAKEFVNHPDHYQGATLEVIEVIDDFKLNYNLGTSIKYILRAGKKDPDKYVQDIEKAIWMLQWEIYTLNRNSSEKVIDKT